MLASTLYYKTDRSHTQNEFLIYKDLTFEESENILLNLKIICSDLQSDDLERLKINNNNNNNNSNNISNNNNNNNSNNNHNNNNYDYDYDAISKFFSVSGIPLYSHPLGIYFMQNNVETTIYHIKNFMMKNISTELNFLYGKLLFRHYFAQNKSPKDGKIMVFQKLIRISK